MAQNIEKKGAITRLRNIKVTVISKCRVVKTVHKKTPKKDFFEIEGDIRIAQNMKKERTMVITQLRRTALHDTIPTSLSDHICLLINRKKDI